MSYALPKYDLWAAALFVLASVTDFVDGYLARKHNKVSIMGKLLDPLADKLLVTTVLIMLLHLGRVHYIYVAILIGREFAVSSLRGIASQEGVVIAASKLAKYKTATQLIALVGLILGHSNQIGVIDWHDIGFVFLVAAVILSILSGIHYFASYRVSTLPGAKHD